jgi:hypothetical protein
MQHVRAQIHSGGASRANRGGPGPALLPSMPGGILRILFLPRAAATENGNDGVPVWRRHPLENLSSLPTSKHTTP